MGTSSARKAPVGKFWRSAKTAAARFASGNEASPPAAREVVACYLTALKSEADDDKKGANHFLPVTVGAAASLGKFYRQWEQEGWEAALQSFGLDAGSPNKADLLPALLDKLSGPGAKLEEAVARAALIDHLAPVLGVDEKSVPPPQSADLPPGSSLLNVCHFLGLALCRTLWSDLGESLEFHAPSVSLGKQRQEEIRSHILGSIQTLKPAEEADISFTSGQMGALVDRILTRLGSRHER